MAVVQISKIQIRRGKKNTGSGLPQLASGELAWAIDTQELFIGNGSVSEGAPYVGNTKVFTENDNLLELLAQYQYKVNDPDIQTGTDPNFPIKRSLQERLDEGSVNAKSYGIIPDTNDQKAKIQQVIFDLYLNSAIDKRVTLEFDPGTYIISDTLYIPSNVRLVGSGKEHTVFSFQNTTGSTSVFKFVNESNSADSLTTFNNQTKNVLLSDFTVNTNSNNVRVFNFTNVRDSEFKNIRMLGTWTHSDAIVTNSIAIEMIAKSALVSCQRNKFEGIEVEGFSYAAFSNTDIINNNFNNCLFKNLYFGVSFGEAAVGDGPKKNTITNSVFDTISRNGILVNKGYANRSINNTFINVGNDTGGYSNSQTGQIKFLVDGNTSTNDVFDRAEDLATAYYGFNYHPEVEGVGSLQINEPRKVTINYSLSTREAFRLPLNSLTGYKVDYVFKNTLSGLVFQIRKGTLHLAVDLTNNNVQLVDEYEYIGAEVDEEKLEFTADVNTATDTLIVYYTNTNNISSQNTLTYTYSSLSSVDV